jgi:hypothetical protein
MDNKEQNLFEAWVFGTRFWYENPDTYQTGNTYYEEFYKQYDGIYFNMYNTRGMFEMIPGERPYYFGYQDDFISANSLNIEGVERIMSVWETCSMPGVTNIAYKDGNAVFSELASLPVPYGTYDHSFFSMYPGKRGLEKAGEFFELFKGAIETVPGPISYKREVTELDIVKEVVRVKALPGVSPNTHTREYPIASHDSSDNEGIDPISLLENSIGFIDKTRLEHWVPRGPVTDMFAVECYDDKGYLESILSYTGLKLPGDITMDSRNRLGAHIATDRVVDVDIISILEFEEIVEEIDPVYAVSSTVDLVFTFGLIFTAAAFSWVFYYHIGKWTFDFINKYQDGNWDYEISYREFLGGDYKTEEDRAIYDIARKAEGVRIESDLAKAEVHTKWAELHYMGITEGLEGYVLYFYENILILGSICIL